MKMSEKYVTVDVEVPEEAEREAKKMGVSLDEFISRACRAFLEMLQKKNRDTFAEEARFERVTLEVPEPVMKFLRTIFEDEEEVKKHLEWQLLEGIRADYDSIEGGGLYGEALKERFEKKYRLSSILEGKKEAEKR